MYSKMLMLSLTLIMTACNSGSGSGDKPKLNPAGACIPEANLEGIVGGEKVGQYDYDANKVVMLLSESSDGVELCTAAPIAPDVLLTAAHCITASASNTKAFATTSATCESGFDRLSQGIVAEAVVVNENYVGVENSSLSSVKSDVALVFLKSSLPNYYPVYKIADSQKQISSKLYLYGYGAVSMKKRSSGILRKTEVQEGLFEIDHSVQEVRIDQTYGRGVCSGDSGGPGLVYINGEYQILGVNSYVSGSRGSDYCMNEGNLALADHYLSWIENKMAARGRSLRK
jgi:secreted trypsin-like serine protease